jgi:hypothetical protein
VKKEDREVVVSKFDVTKTNPSRFSGSFELSYVNNIHISARSDSDDADSDAGSSWSAATTLQFQMDPEGEDTAFDLEVQAGQDSNADNNDLAPGFDTETLKEKLRRLGRFRPQDLEENQPMLQRWPMFHRQLAIEAASEADVSSPAADCIPFVFTSDPVLACMTEMQITRVVDVDSDPMPMDSELSESEATDADDDVFEKEDDNEN